MPTLNWVGKNKVINLANKCDFKILEKKYTFSLTGAEHSQNKIIHGDNLEALKALLPEYEGKIKCVYIDPPYNTGNEGWVYNDNVRDPKIKKWLGLVVGPEGEDLNRHDKWLCMMMPRLKLLHRLLKQDGVIFISIDDNEQAHLKLLCDEVFGERNFVNCFIWQRNSSAKTEIGKFTVNTEYVLLYAKSGNYTLNNAYKPLSEASQKLFKFDDNDSRGKYQTVSLQKPGSPGPETTYDYVDNNGKIWKCPAKGWRMKYEKVKALENDNRLILTGNSLRVKDYWNERENEGKRIDTLWNDLAQNTAGSSELRRLLGDDVIFNNPKPTALIKRCIQICDKDAIVLDSFAGSGTTAHAVLELNKADGGNRHFILVEMADYANTITAERVKKVITGFGEGAKQKEGTGGDFDFFEMGEQVLLYGKLNENVPLGEIRKYIYFTETRQKVENATTETGEYYLGTYKEVAYYFYYKKDIATWLDINFLESLKYKAKGLLIYADACSLSKEQKQKYNVVFKKIPRDIKKL